MNKITRLQKALKKLERNEELSNKEIGVCLEALYLVGQTLTNKKGRTK